MRWRCWPPRMPIGTGSSARTSTTCPRAPWISSACRRIPFSLRARTIWRARRWCARTWRSGSARWPSSLPAPARGSAWSCARSSAARSAGCSTSACVSATRPGNRCAGAARRGTSRRAGARRKRCDSPRSAMRAPWKGPTQDTGNGTSSPTRYSCRRARERCSRCRRARCRPAEPRSWRWCRSIPTSRFSWPRASGPTSRPDTTSAIIASSRGRAQCAGCARAARFSRTRTAFRCA